VEIHRQLPPPPDKTLFQAERTQDALQKLLKALYQYEPGLVRMIIRDYLRPRDSAPRQLQSYYGINRRNAMQLFGTSNPLTAAFLRMEHWMDLELIKNRRYDTEPEAHTWIGRVTFEMDERSFDESKKAEDDFLAQIYRRVVPGAMTVNRRPFKMTLKQTTASSSPEQTDCNGLRVGDRVRCQCVDYGEITAIDYDTGMCQFQKDFNRASEPVLCTSVGRLAMGTGRGWRSAGRGAGGAFQAFDGPLVSYEDRYEDDNDFAYVGGKVLCKTVMDGKVLSIEDGTCKIVPTNNNGPPIVRACNEVSRLISFECDVQYKDHNVSRWAFPESPQSVSEVASVLKLRGSYPGDHLLYKIQASKLRAEFPSGLHDGIDGTTTCIMLTYVPYPNNLETYLPNTASMMFPTSGTKLQWDSDNRKGVFQLFGMQNDMDDDDDEAYKHAEAEVVHAVEFGRVLQEEALANSRQLDNEANQNALSILGAQHPARVRRDNALDYFNAQQPARHTFYVKGAQMKRPMPTLVDFSAGSRAFQMEELNRTMLKQIVPRVYWWSEPDPTAYAIDDKTVARNQWTWKLPICELFPERVDVKRTGSRMMLLPASAVSTDDADMMSVDSAIQLLRATLNIPNDLLAEERIFFGLIKDRLGTCERPQKLLRWFRGAHPRYGVPAGGVRVGLTAEQATTLTNAADNAAQPWNVKYECGDVVFSSVHGRCTVVEVNSDDDTVWIEEEGDDPERHWVDHSDLKSRVDTAWEASLSLPPI
jgi:hypothetical protein